MRVKIGLVFAVAAAALLWVAPKATADPDTDKYMWVCHQVGNGDTQLLIAGVNAAFRHADNHGDEIYPYVINQAPPCF